MNNYNKARAISKREGCTVQKIKEGEFALYSKTDGSWMGALGDGFSQGVCSNYIEVDGMIMEK